MKTGSYGMSTSKTDHVLKAIKEDFTNVRKKMKEKCLNIDLAVSGYHNIVLRLSEYGTFRALLSKL